MDRNELKRKYDIVANDNYKELREELLNYIVDKSNSPTNADIIRGMLLLINESDRWEKAYLAECEKERSKYKE